MPCLPSSASILYGDIWGDIDLDILPVDTIYVQLLFRIPGHITSTVYTPAEISEYRLMSACLPTLRLNYYLLPAALRPSAARDTFSSCRFLRPTIQQLLCTSIRLCLGSPEYAPPPGCGSRVK